MELFENQFVKIPIYYIKGCDNCYFTSRNEIYNINSKRISKERINGGSLGYTINGIFVNSKNIVKLKVEKLSKNL